MSSYANQNKMSRKLSQMSCAARLKMCVKNSCFRASLNYPCFKWFLDIHLKVIFISSRDLAFKQLSVLYYVNQDRHGRRVQLHCCVKVGSLDYFLCACFLKEITCWCGK